MTEPKIVTVNVAHPRRVHPWLYVYVDGVMVAQHQSTRTEVHELAARLREHASAIATDPFVVTAKVLGEPNLDNG